MRKILLFAGILLIALLICGCPPKPKVEPVTVKTDMFDTLFAEGLKYETQQEWRKARTAFYAAISEASDDQQTQEAQKCLANVEKQLRLQALYEKFVDYQKSGESDKMRDTLSAAYKITSDHYLIPKMMAVLSVKHNILPGDRISELCQHYYGKTESYELVHKVNAYNKITTPEKIESGQVIIFPVIDLPEKPLYFPNPKPPPPSPPPADSGKTKPVPQI